MDFVTIHHVVDVHIVNESCCGFVIHVTHTRTHTHTHTHNESRHMYEYTCCGCSYREWVILCIFYLYERVVCQSCQSYGVATISRLLKTIGLFCRMSSLLRVSFAKEAYNFKEPTDRSPPIAVISVQVSHDNRVMSHIWLTRFTYTNKPCRTSHVTHMNETFPYMYIYIHVHVTWLIYRCDMSLVWKSSFIHVDVTRFHAQQAD